MITDEYGNRRFFGIYRGVVQDNADPLGKGRVKLRIPQVLFEAITDWAWAKDAHGVHVDPPVIGQGVWVQFEGGDPSFPVWVGTFGDNPIQLVGTGGGGGGSFDDLTDATITSPTNRQVPVYNGATGQWENDSVAIPAGGTAGQVLAKSSDSNYVVSWVSGTNVPASTVKHIVRNDSGVTLSKGTVVYTSGANGTHILVKPALATADQTSAQVVGFLEVTLAPNADGYAISEGLLSDLDTSAAGAEGDPIWLSGTVAGGVVYGFANEPYAPTHLVYLGVVTRKNPTNGQVFIRISNGWELDELHNVNINHATALNNKDILQYDSATSLWKNTPLSVTTDNIVDGTIVNSDINTSAAIASTKISGTAVTQADTGTVTNAMLAGSITNGKLLQPFVTVNGTTINLGGTGTVTATTTNSLGLTSGGNLSFSSGTTWNGGTAGITIGLSTTPTGITSINGVTMPTSGSFITSATTSLPNVTSVNGTSIPSAATLVSTTDLATTTVTGIASFDSGDFSVTAGAVTIKSAGVDIAQGGTGASTAFTARTNLAATTTGAVHTGTVAPTTDINVGDYWLDPNTGNLFVYYTDAGGGQWIQTASGLSGGADIRGRVGSLETRTTAVEGVNTTQNGFLVPTGCIMQWATNTPPSGWLLCDGQSTSGYAALAAIVGASVPDLRGRVPVGRNSGTFATLGATGGAETNTHNHYQTVGSDPSNFFATNNTNSGPRSRVVTKTRSVTATSSASAVTREDSTYDETISTLPPYIVLNYIIKT